ncbi:MAG: LON peptidase substrate-binding domain-containing protein [Thermomicrobiales bacterium]
MSDLLPLIPLGTVAFPGMPVPLRIFEERYRRLLEDRHQADPAFGIVLLRTGRDTDAFGPDSLHGVGTATRILSRRRLPGGQSDIVVKGTRRFAIRMVNWDMGYALASVEWQDEPIGDMDRLVSAMRSATDDFSRYVQAVTAVTGHPFRGIHIGHDPATASWDLAARLPLHTWERQQLLEMPGAQERFAAIARLIRRERRLLATFGTPGVPLDHSGHRFTLN